MSGERKGILKRPATAPRPFFSFTRDMLSISRLLGPGGQPGGATPGMNDGERGVLKRAHFIVPEMRVVYPISNTTAPSNTAQSEARLEIDAAERLRRETEQREGWTAARVEALYRDVCKLRDERVNPTISAQIRATPNAPRVLDLSHTHFTFDAASALADLLALDWGLQRLILSDCDLDDLTLKPILHALLIPDSLPYLALANNKRLRFSAFKMISAFLTRAHALEFIDLSLNAMDKRSVESILAVLPPAPPNPPPAPTPRMSRQSSFASIDASTPTVQFSNPFDSSVAGKGAVRPSIDTSVPRRVRDPARYPESPGAGPSSPRGSVSSPLLGSPRASVSSIGSQSTPRAGSPIDKSSSSLGGGSWQGQGKKKSRTRRALVGVRLDECALRGPGLEALAHAIRTSQIQTVSLRTNRIGQAGAVAVALMIKDYPDQLAGGTSISVPSSSISGASSYLTPNSNAGLGLGLGTGPSSTPASSAPPSPRPGVPSLSNSNTGTSSGPSNASVQSSITGHSSLTGHSNTTSNPDSSNRPNMQSHSSLTTVSTFKEHDILASPPPVRASLVPGANGTAVPPGGAGVGGSGTTKPEPPVVAPKPSRLQARLAGAVASGSRAGSPPGSGASTPPPQLQTQQAAGQMTTQHPQPPPPHPSSATKPLMPPPRHPAAHPAPPVPGTNYTAYIPRVRRTAGGSISGSISGIQPGTPVGNQNHAQPSTGVANGAGSGTGTIPVPYVPRQTPLSVRLQNAARAAAGTPPSGTRPSSSGPGVGGGGTGGSAVTMITSSSFGGVTTRLPTVPAGVSLSTPGGTTGPSGGSGGGSAGSGSTGGGTSAALMDIVRSMEGVPKLGCLVVLDLRGNDLRGGVSYIAQVLKRNRTLRSLNLSENKIEVQGLILLAEALKYNSTLTSLDLSNNPCSSPSLEGIHVLRNALTLNTTLHHLSLAATSLTPQGAIALAEFLPDFPALQHLDLTSNTLDVAGVLALSVGLKVNYGMRCLDLSIVPGEEEMARLCREILKICLRNTEKAQAAGQARAGKVAEGMLSPMLEDVPVPSITGSGTSSGGVWDPIEHSALAREANVNINATAAAGVDPAGRIGVWKMTPMQVMAAARECADEFAAGVGGEEGVRRAREVRAVLVEMIRTERDEGVLGEMLVLNDALAPVVGADASPGAGAGAVAERKEGWEEGIRKNMGLGLSIDGEEAKGDAAPEAEGEGDGEGDADGEGDGEGSPAENLSRSWVAEEGEILRKGRVLLSYNELESESGADGEALRQELLEAQVERAPARIVEEQEEETLATEPPQPEDVEDGEEGRT